MSLKGYIGSQFAMPRGKGGRISTAIMNLINTEHYRAVNNYVCKQEGARVLDIGFGNGYMLRLLSRYEGLKLYGIDISADMINSASDVSAQLIQASVTDIPFFEGFFDSIYTINTVYFWEEYEQAFASVKRVLKNGGEFICTFYGNEYLDKLPYCDEGFRKFTPYELRDMAKENGFADVKIKILEKDKSYCLICKKP